MIPSLKRPTAAVFLLALAGCFTGGGRDSAVIKPILVPGGPPEGHVEIRRIAELADRNVSESSGVAVSRRSRNLLWTHNDSGDGPRLYAFDAKGRSVATIEVMGAGAYDWEDMASASIRGTPYLIVADTGDNERIRPSYSIYLIEEPSLAPASQALAATVAVTRVIHFTYEDGPQDCESVGVNPEAEMIYLVSKDRSADTKVYALDLPFDDGTNAVVARVMAKLADVHAVTSFDISADNHRAVVLTYDDAFEYARESGESWATAFERTPRHLPMPWRALGEAICYGADGQTLYLTSENAPSPLWEVRIVNGRRSSTQVATNAGAASDTL